jgi:cytochrome d ubiquinol oxidase subunit II
VTELVSLPVFLAGVIVVSLNAYVLLAGADFGGGVWDMFAAGPRRAQQRALVANALGPVWEANHVWLILVIVLLFTCFPPVFAALSITLHIPLALMLVGIVMRGAAFTFRSYDSQRDTVQRRWSRIFAIASLITPVLLGVCVGAVAAGRIPIGSSFGFTAEAFGDSYIAPWATLFGLLIGLLALALFALVAAVYLTLETADPELRDDFRRRALVAQAAAFAAAGIALPFAHGTAPLVHEGLLRGGTAAVIITGTAITVAVTVWALWTRRYQLARIAAAAQASAILWGWPVAQYPYLLPPHTTIDEAAAPAITLRLVLAALVVGGLILFPSLAYLFRVFKGRNGVRTIGNAPLNR